MIARAIMVMTVIAGIAVIGADSAAQDRPPAAAPQAQSIVPPTTPAAWQEYRSARMTDFTGEIGGPYRPADLMNATVVDGAGARLGTIEDLLIGAGDRVDSVLLSTDEDVDTGVVVELTILREAPDGVGFSLGKDRSELAALTSYERIGEIWQPASVPTE
jgi:hypothetical protein